MTPENASEVETAKLLPLEVLALRMSFDVRMERIVKHLGELHEKSEQPLPRPFDGVDHSAETSIFLAEALLRNQVFLLEIRTANASRGKPSVKRMLAESNARKLEMILVEATRLAIEVHMQLHEVG